MSERAIDLMSMADSGEPLASLRRFSRIAGVPGPTVLRLEKIEEPEPMPVKRVIACARPARTLAAQELITASDGTPQDNVH